MMRKQNKKFLIFHFVLSLIYCIFAKGNVCRSYMNCFSFFLQYFICFITKLRTMALNPNKNVKVYFSIKEVATQVGVTESTLRFWEKEFPLLKPKTSPNGVRQYIEKDIEQIKLIYNLIKVRGFKIAAARKYMNENRNGVDKSSDILNTLISVRENLKELKRQLDGIV